MPNPGPGPVLLALGLALATVILSAPALAQEAGAPIPWTVEVPEVGTLVVDRAPGWDAAGSPGGDGLAQWRATTKSRCEMLIRVTASPFPDPAFNGPEALRAFVRRQAETLLPQAIESRYTLRELRGPEAGGFHFGLRDRAPRRKQAAYITRGAVGLWNLLIEFTLTSPDPNPPEILEALNRLAASRVSRTGEEGATP